MTPEAGAPSPRPPGHATGGGGNEIARPRFPWHETLKTFREEAGPARGLEERCYNWGQATTAPSPRAQQPNAAHPLPPPSPKWRRSRPALRKWGRRRFSLSIRGRPRHFLFGKVRRSGRGGRAGSGKDPRRLLRGTCAEGRDVRGHVGRPESVAAAGREVGTARLAAVLHLRRRRFLQKVANGPDRADEEPGLPFGEGCLSRAELFVGKPPLESCGEGVALTLPMLLAGIDAALRQPFPSEVYQGC